MRSLKGFLVNSIQLAAPGGANPTLVSRVLVHLQTPLLGNGYALVLSSISTSALGMVYWILAAHLYSPAVVGFNSAAISAMMLLAGIAQLNLNNAFIRFIRSAGRLTRRFALLAYAASVVMAGTICLILLLGINRLAPALGFLAADPYLAAWFVLATVMWCIFVLQDGLLTGLRFAIWVPVENTIYALTKIALLVVLSFNTPAIGIFAAWTIAVVASIAPTNFFIFSKLIPQQMRAVTGDAASLATGRVVKFVAADYFGSLSWMAVTYLLPVIVAAIISPEANAYYYLSWTIAATLYLITPNIGSSFIVETASHPEKLPGHLREVFFQVIRLILPLMALVVVGAPLILQVFGRAYSTEGATLLRLLALSALPNVINSLFASVARVQQRRTALLVTLFSSSVLVLGLSLFFIAWMGIVGVGLAFLVGQTTLAVVILATQFQRVWPKPARSPASSGGRPVRFDWMILRRAAPPLHWVRNLNFRRNRQIARLLTGVIATIPPQAAFSDPAAWTSLKPVATVTDRQVYFLGEPHRLPAAVLKLPTSSQALTGSQRELAALNALRLDGRLAGWDSLLPVVIAQGKIGRQDYLVERVLPGITAQRLLQKNVDWRVVQATAAAAISDLHCRTAAATVVTSRHLKQWVHDPAETLHTFLASADHGSPAQQQLDRVVERLQVVLTGCRLPMGWVHGDYAPGNILMTRDGRSVTGIVDWELADRESLPWLDIGMLLLSTRMLVRGAEFGNLVQSFLKGERWTGVEQETLDRLSQVLASDPIDPHTLILLCWLQHVANNIAKSTRYHTQRLWLNDNLLSVLSLFS